MYTFIEILVLLKFWWQQIATCLPVYFVPDAFWSAFFPQAGSMSISIYDIAFLIWRAGKFLGGNFTF